MVKNISENVTYFINYNEQSVKAEICVKGRRYSSKVTCSPDDIFIVEEGRQRATLKLFSSMSNKILKELGYGVKLIETFKKI